MLLIASSRAMALRALLKRVGRLFGSRRQRSPFSSLSGQSCAAGASELSDKGQGRLPYCGLTRRRWYFKRVGTDPRDQQRR